VVSTADCFENKKVKKQYSEEYKQGQQVQIEQLKIGDYVVHKNQGIGQFIGINTITAGGITKDYIKILYSDDGILYVPTNSLDNIRRYIATGDVAPKLNKLGSKDWQKTKAKVKSNLRAVAKDLMELYAKRSEAKGFAFAKDTEWQKEFEATFPYTETDDQFRSIEEVKKDMENIKPMDRLLCGDVGYGKTEVAIRAAFKACMDGKQVAYLVPTTILSNQQYHTFKERMEKFSIKVELLNRFKSAKQQTEIIKKLKLGEIDIIIGTHRILSEDIGFKNLGLLIVDEEHRFGVKAKEKIKQIKTNVDVLSMSATPIPRTLHMSIVGLRDMSVIYDPPNNRKPVQTYVLEYDEDVIKEAITKELERNGQVFYLLNSVEGVSAKSVYINNLVPEASVGFAHGQMTGRELEDIMQKFIDKKINVLVCTTILESGIDIPNANTIIVENADRLGLAQLYQIRGRVGRSDTQAYAYITYKRDKLISEIAEKRLRAIKEFTEFGSGFKIAMRDLEIRGAGSLLGEIQHGHMDMVGYDMYCKLLDEVIKESKGEVVEEEEEVQIDISVSCYIPNTFIDKYEQKIEIYQNIALCSTEMDIQNVIDEIIDRYGNLPEEIENLLEISRIKNMCKRAGIVKVAQKDNRLVFTCGKRFNPSSIEILIRKYNNRIRIGTADTISVVMDEEDIGDDKAVLGIIKEFLACAGGCRGRRPRRPSTRAFFYIGGIIMEIIKSKENEKIKHIKKLKDKKYRDEFNQYVIEGTKMIEEAITEQVNIESIVICEDCIKDVNLSEAMLYEIAKYNCIYVTENIFTSLTEVLNPQGILAIINKSKIKKDIDYTEDIIIVLDNIQDPGNMGTILRTIDSINLKQVIVSKNSADVYNSKVIRSTMGAIFRLNIIESIDLEKTLTEIKKHKYKIVVTSLNAEENLYQTELKKVAIVMGNEGNGVSESVLKKADKQIKIPILGATESLNVSVATGIILYEYVRRIIPSII